MNEQPGKPEPERPLPNIDKQLEAVNLELHPQAEKLVSKHVNEFAVSLLPQAKLLAWNRNDDIVLSTHVEAALNSIRKSEERKRVREIAILLGSALIGAFIQGSLTELSNNRAVWVFVYAIWGMIGASLVFWGFRK
jgi:hypothetical protein